MTDFSALWVAMGGLASPAPVQDGPPLPCTFGACTDSDHDHADASGNPLRCMSCEAPLHYVISKSDVRHDDPDLGCLVLDPWGK